MPRGRAVQAAAALILIAAGIVAWRIWFASDEQVIRGRLMALKDEVNLGATDGLESVARAAAIGGFFAEDVVVDLGQGTAPITGRETVMGMTARLQPRTAAFRLDLADIGVEVRPGHAAADVTLTATFTRRSISTGEESIDAREFTLVMSKAGGPSTGSGQGASTGSGQGPWRISRLTAVDTLK